MKLILCATDLSRRSELAVDRASALARQFGAELLLLHVVDDDQPRALIEFETDRARAMLDARATALTGAGVSGAKAEVKSGSAFRTIVECAQSSNADLIVMGAHRRRILRDVIVGTTIERVMRTGHRPILMVNTPMSDRYESVLLALDESDASASAVRAAKSLGLLDNVRISVIHAFEPIYKGMLGWAGVRDDTIAEYSATWARQAEDAIGKFISEMAMDRAAVHVMPQEGPPLLAIKRMVEGIHPHLLVIGTHGRTGVKRALLGSVAEQVVGQIECDILVVPQVAAGGG